MKTVSLCLLLVVQLLLGDRVTGLNPNLRVSHGHPARVGEFNYVAYISSRAYNDDGLFSPFDDTSMFCTGFVVSPNWVMTAAHCLHPMYLYNTFNKDKDNRYDKLKVEYKIFLGATKMYDYEQDLIQLEKEISVSDVFPHPHAMTFNGTHDTNGTYLVDAALLHIAEALPFSPLVGSIPLMTGDFPKDFPGRCLAMGFGKTSINENPLKLHYLKVKTGGVDYCRTLNPTDKWQEYHLCVTNEDKSEVPCSGDSGGPLVCGHPERPVAVGIAHGSWEEEICGQPLQELHYISTGYLEEWVKEVTKGEGTFLEYKASDYNKYEDMFG